VVFAAVQWNDPDPYLWVFLYLVMALIPVLYLKAKLNRKLLAFVGLVLAGLTVTYVPDFITWFQDGMPSITTSMKAESPYIELVRESMGLLICLVVVVYYLIKTKVS